MAQFESGVKYVPYSQEQVFNKLSDLSNLESVRDKLADEVQGMEFDSDSLSFTVQG
ncbi:SRPBCC family protein, partial [Bacteroides thetaiotaomicron]